MKCREVEQLWEEWLSGGSVPLLEQHFRECAGCRELAAELARTPAWLALLREEPREPGPAFWIGLQERLEETRFRWDFWTTLGWAASRAAVVLAVLVLLFAVAVLQAPPEPAMAEFDAPPIYVETAAGNVPVANGQLNRDQVMLTLVAQVEPPR